MSLERFRMTRFLLLALLFAGLVACAPAAEESAPAEATAEEPAAMEEEAGKPRVFFVEPTDGAEVTSPVKVVFGAENFTIEPRGDGQVHHGAGHHHLGVDTHCFEAGVVIPEAEPWIHFGDGSNTIDVQLPPGEHHLSMQAGDGEHRTLDEPGLCDMINITVVEAETE
jgi:hypothetical protein